MFSLRWIPSFGASVEGQAKKAIWPLRRRALYPKEFIKNELLGTDVPFQLFLVVQRVRGRPALLLGTVASVSVVGLWLVGLVLPPNGCTPPNLFRLVLVDLFG